MSDFHNEEIITCRKARKCPECFNTISVGDKYTRLFGVNYGDFYSEKLCLTCAEIRELLFSIRIKGGLYHEEAGVALGDLYFEVKDEIANDSESPLCKYLEHFNKR